MQEEHPNEMQPRAQPPVGSVPAQTGGDTVYYEGRARHSARFGSYFLWTLVCIAGGVIAWLLGQVEAVAALALPLWVLALVGIPGLLITYLRQVTTKFKVSTKWIETEKGILLRKVDSLELWRVLDVAYEQSILDRIFGIAKIRLTGTDQSDPVLEMHGLPNHRELFEKLRDAVQYARQRGRPMELVGQDGMEAHDGIGGMLHM